MTWKIQKYSFLFPILIHLLKDIDWDSTVDGTEGPADRNYYSSAKVFCKILAFLIDVFLG